MSRVNVYHPQNVLMYNIRCISQVYSGTETETMFIQEEQRRKNEKEIAKYLGNGLDSTRWARRKNPEKQTADIGE